MKTNHKILLTLLIVSAIFFSCKKETSLKTTSYKNVSATVVRDNPNVIGSCGWRIALRYATCFPDTLDTTGLHSGQHVVIDYTLTGDSAGCGDIVLSYSPVIHIDSLRR